MPTTTRKGSGRSLRAGVRRFVPRISEALRGFKSDRLQLGQGRHQKASSQIGGLPVIISIDMRWGITSRGSIPIHHQYLLFSAISRIVPDVHATAGFGVHPIRGMRTTPGRLDLLPYSSLTMRTRVEDVPALLPLTGKKLDLASCPIRLGIPYTIALSGCPTLKSPLVTIKGYMEEKKFGSAIRRQLDALGISLSVTVEVGARKVLRIKQQLIIGFTVTLGNLEHTESLLIQSSGLGGRRHLGCGIFNPGKEPDLE
jgi:CRISPR-associated protein Cas6